MRGLQNLVIVTALGVGLGGWLSMPLPATPARAYTVQAEDTLGAIAARHGTTTIDLIAVNVVRYPELIVRVHRPLPAGWELTLSPAKGTTPRWLAWASSAAQAARDRIAPFLRSVLDELRAPAAPRRTSEGGSPRPAVPAGFDDAAALEVVRLTNERRAAAGMPPLSVDESLMEIARKRATEIVDDWGHAGLADDCGSCGENIIQGPRWTTPAHLVEWWMESDGHRANIVSNSCKST